MAAPVQTFTLDSHYSIFRRIITPALVTPIGGGATQARRRYQRPVYGFTIKDSHAIKSSAEYIYSFMQYHQGDVRFWWDGNTWGTVSTPILFGFGDGVRTQFFLNNRHITTGTLQAYTNGVLASPQPTIDLASGLLTYSAAPVDQGKLTATYVCRYRCVFEVEGDVLQSEELMYQALFKYEGVKLREVIP
jgi:hypothetical protein